MNGVLGVGYRIRLGAALRQAMQSAIAGVDANGQPLPLDPDGSSLMAALFIPLKTCILNQCALVKTPAQATSILALLPHQA
jgi:hypothetical protein